MIEPGNEKRETKKTINVKLFSENNKEIKLPCLKIYQSGSSRRLSR